MYKSIKIYTRTRCQVSVYRTTGPLVLSVINCWSEKNFHRGKSKVKGFFLQWNLCQWLFPTVSRMFFYNVDCNLWAMTYGLMPTAVLKSEAIGKNRTGASHWYVFFVALPRKFWTPGRPVNSCVFYSVGNDWKWLALVRNCKMDIEVLLWQQHQLNWANILISYYTLHPMSGRLSLLWAFSLLSFLANSVFEFLVQTHSTLLPYIYISGVISWMNL